MPTQSSSGASTKSATELMQAYLDSIQDPDRVGALFADEGVLELPWIKVRAQGPEGITGLVAGIRKKVPEFRFKNIQFWIQTHDRVYAEYQVEAPVVDTGKVYNQTYCGADRREWAHQAAAGSAQHGRGGARLQQGLRPLAMRVSGSSRAGRRGARRPLLQFLRVPRWPDRAPPHPSRPRRSGRGRGAVQVGREGRSW